MCLRCETFPCTLLKYGLLPQCWYSRATSVNLSSPALYFTSVSKPKPFISLKAPVPFPCQYSSPEKSPQPSAIFGQAILYPCHTTSINSLGEGGESLSLLSRVFGGPGMEGNGRLVTTNGNSGCYCYIYPYRKKKLAFSGKRALDPFFVSTERGNGWGRTFPLVTGL